METRTSEEAEHATSEVANENGRRRRGWTCTRHWSWRTRRRVGNVVRGNGPCTHFVAIELDGGKISAQTPCLHHNLPSRSDALNLFKLMDCSTFAALAQIQILLLPIGSISRTTFDLWARTIRTFNEIRLSDVQGDSKDDTREYTSSCQTPECYNCL